MKKTALLALVLCLSVACERKARESSHVVTCRVSGSREFPYILGNRDDNPDATVEVRAIHAPSKQRFTAKFHLKLLSASEWKKRELSPAFHDPPGADVRVQYVEAVAGAIRFDDETKAHIPFHQNQRNTSGLFEYEVIWQKTAYQPLEPIRLPRAPVARLER